MDFNFDEIKFGNPSAKQKKLLETDTYLDELFKDMSIINPPSNSSKITKEELNETVTRIADVSQEVNQAHLKRYLASYQNHSQFIINQLNHKDIDILGVINDVCKDVDPLIMKLKFKFQRPTPRLLSFYYKLKLFPIALNKEETPSYPNRSIIITHLVCNIIGNRVPDLYEKSQKVINFISSRDSYLGNCYISDIDFGIVISEFILQNKTFTSKYKI